MQRLVSTLAMSAALVAVGLALWRDYGVLVTLKRAAIAYFAMYAVGSLLVFVFKAGIEEQWIREAAIRRNREEAIKRAKQRALEEQHYAQLQKDDEELEPTL
jgi:cytochrome b subunit of formate dehydrogenase